MMINGTAMTQRFIDKVVVVIGGNSGIGLASAKAFAAEGATVVVTGRDHETLAQAEREIGHGAIAHRSDICDLPQTAALFSRIREKLGRVDVLFVNAGVLALHPIESVTEAGWDQVQNTNLKGVFFCVQAALPLMAAGSAVVLTGSTAARKAAPTALVYAASKAGLRSMGRSLAAGLVERMIRVNVVSPGPTETPMYYRANGLRPDAVSDLRQSIIELMPMKRMALPAEVATAVLFLSSDDAAFITGIDFLVDSGVASF
jgi:NAD(P)-dependent dehydrogenase (short-subunit alcohol dehydrogenase family)